MKPLLLPGGFYAYPLGINNQGQIVGYADKDDPNSEHTVGAAFLYENGAITELVDLTSRSADPIGINNHGHIVGKAILGGKARAYIYRDDIFTDLNSLIDPNSGWVLELANDINDKGQIVGDGIFNGEFRVFRLDPIPEPSTFALLVGTMGMSFLRRRR
jgi:probable HAF family extracellular repeat protein